MDLINQIGISYKANYLIQGNYEERCEMSTKLRANNTELRIKSDGKDFDISNILKSYRGNIIFHIPSVSIDLSNLKNLNSKVRTLINNNVKMVNINASNLSLDLFEWSTIEEQKKYFLNIVTGIATLAANKIVVCIENMPSNSDDSMFGCNYNQISDILVYSRKLLIKDFGFNENDATNYIGLCLNISVLEKENQITSLGEWFSIFNKNIKCIKFSNGELLDSILDFVISNEYDGPILFETKSELEEIEQDYISIDKKVKEKLNQYNMVIGDYKIKTLTDSGFSNIIVLSIILITIAIAILMVIVKVRG